METNKTYRTISVKERNPNNGKIDSYHVNIRPIGSEEECFPDSVTFSGEWEVSDGYEVVEWLEEIPLPAVIGKTYRWVKASDRMPDNPGTYMGNVSGGGSTIYLIEGHPYFTRSGGYALKNNIVEWLEEIPSSPAVPQGAEEWWNENIYPMKDRNGKPREGWMSKQQFLAYAQQQLPQSSPEIKFREAREDQIEIGKKVPTWFNAENWSINLGGWYFQALFEKELSTIQKEKYIFSEICRDENELNAFRLAIEKYAKENDYKIKWIKHPSPATDDKRKLVTLTCMVCKKSFQDEEPQRCCNGSECGCAGMPVDPIACSPECLEILMNPPKQNATVKGEALSAEGIWDMRSRAVPEDVYSEDELDWVMGEDVMLKKDFQEALKEYASRLQHPGPAEIETEFNERFGKDIRVITSAHLNEEFIKNNDYLLIGETVYAKEEQVYILMKKYLSLYNKYLTHLPECNTMKDWTEAQTALWSCKEGTSKDEAIAKMEIDMNTCTCGLDALLKDQLPETVPLPTISDEELEKLADNNLEGVKKRSKIRIYFDRITFIKGFKQSLKYRGEFTKEDIQKAIQHIKELCQYPNATEEWIQSGIKDYISSLQPLK